MKKVILTLIFLACLVFPINTTAGFSIGENNKNEYQYIFNRNFFSDTIDLVFEDGTWWIYEYDEDGKLYEVYPLL